MGIIIFSRSIRSGKTTQLLNWCAGKTNVAGILMPDVKGVRHFLNLASGETFRAECVEETGEDMISVGKYSFSKTAFTKANQLLLDAVKEMPEVLVIDEVGKLELQQLGLYEAVRKAVEVYKDETLGKVLILVVREGLVKVVVDAFGITEYELVQNLELIK